MGNYKNPGRCWCKDADNVLVHDWPADAVGQAIPYGIYDLTRNHGYVVIGDCFDTPRFAVEAISDWWWEEGQHAFPEAERLLVLADAGGSNSCRSRVWKAQIQEQLCDAFGLAVTVCHYPTGCSKWNPIEHRLFSFLSLNWAGLPLRSFELIQRHMPHRRHHHRLRPDGDGLPEARRQRTWRDRLRRGDGAAVVDPPPSLPGVELHALTAPQTYENGGLIPCRALGSVFKVAPNTQMWPPETT